MNWIIERLKEKTTWIGLIGILGSVGVVLTPEQTEAITAACVAIAGAVLVFTSEKK